MRLHLPPARLPSACDNTAQAGTYSVWLLDGVQRVHNFPAPPAGVPCCCGMPRGWMALSDHEKSPTRVILWEPSSGVEMALPALNSILQVFLSADPAAVGTPWMAFASQRRVDVAQRMHFWRPGDESWSLMMHGEGNSTLLLVE